MTYINSVSIFIQFIPNEKEIKYNKQFGQVVMKLDRTVYITTICDYTSLHDKNEQRYRSFEFLSNSH